MSNVTLYNIQNEQKAIMAEIEMAEGEITPAILERIQFVEERFEEKATNYGYVIKTYEDNSKILADEIKRLQELKKKEDRKVEVLTQRIKEAMLQFNLEKVETPIMKFSFHKSTAVEILDENAIEARFSTFKTQPDKVAIKKALEAGEQVMGAVLVENLNLQIK
jgi:recombination DNA repair RAD52 pathway protein